MTARQNAELVLHTVSSEDPTSRASRRAAEDVLRLLDPLRRIAENDPPENAVHWSSGRSWRIELARQTLREASQ